jgi:uncharacterized protein (TIGR03382 family)
MVRRATLLLLLLPGAALAQTTAGTTTALVSTQGTAGVASRAECADTSAVATWRISSSVTPVTANGDKYRLGTVATSTGCQTSGGLPTGIAADVTATGATQSVTGVGVAAMASSGGVTSCTQSTDVTINLCVYYLQGGSTTTWQLASQGTFVFQMAIPPAPVISGVSPGNTQLSVSVAPGNTTSTETATTGVTYEVTCTPPAGGGKPSIATGNAGNVVCGNLTNGLAYTVTAVGLSQAGNRGPASAAFGPGESTTPQPFLNFWEIYKGQGGVENGGCGAGGAGALAPALALLGFLGLRRRRP